MRPIPSRYLRDLLEHTSLIAYLKHADGKYIYVNRMYEAVARVPAKKIIGRYDRDIFPKPVADLFTDQDRQVIAKKAPVEFEETIPLPDGVLSFITAKFPLFDAGGEVWAVGGVCTNVTALKKAQEELQSSQRRFEALLDNSWDGVMIVDHQGVIKYHSPSVKEILGYAPEEVTGRPIWEFVLLEKDKGMAEAFQELVGSPEMGGRRELQLKHKDGSLRTVEGVANNLLENSQIQGIVINYHDVTARRLAEDHLIESERLYRALVETTNTGYVVVDSEGRVVDANPEYIRLAGHRSIEEIRGHSVVEWTAPEDRERNAREVVRCFSAGAVRNLEVLYADGQGRRTPIEINATVVEIGEKPLIMTICRDITARRKAEEDLRRNEAQLAEAENLAAMGSFDCDIPSGKVVRSAGLYALLGTTREQMGDRLDAFLDLVHPDDRARTQEKLQRCIRQGLPFQNDHRVIRPDGVQLTLHAEGRVTKDEQGRPVRFFGWLQDITERRKAEEDLRRSEAMLAEAERLAGIGSVSHDLQAGKFYRSAGIHRIFGAGKDEMPDEWLSFMRYVHEEDRERLAAAIRRSVEEGSPLVVEYRIRRPDGAERVVHAEGGASRDAQGKPARFFSWLQDITERRSLEEKVLQIGDRERRNIGHDLHDDLGQQLTGIALLGRALQERLAGQDSPEAGAMADLLKHVDNALARVREMSRGLQAVPARPEGLREALAGLASHVGGTAQLTCNLWAAEDIRVDDPNVANHLYRIAQEAVHNAMRHGGARAIAISLAQQAEGLTLTVADDGEGLLRTPKKGSGMGLDIMRHRASLIHGTLTISSQAGRGTRIVCRVPAQGKDNGGVL